jgi:hypothetical membrane protein
MTEREQPPYPAGYRPVPDDDWRESTTPGITPVRDPRSTSAYGSTGYVRPPVDQPPSYEQPRYPRPGYGSDYGRAPADQGYGRPRYDQSGYGEPGYGPPGYGETAYGRPGAPVEATTPAYSTRPVAARRPDPLAALALLLAGIVAAVSLLVTWLAHSQATGWTLLRDAFRDLGGLFHTGLWQPLAIIVGGGLLFLLGLLVLIPARAHRTLGLLALLVTGAVGAGVAVPLVDANGHLGVFDLGFFLGIAVAVLGLIGSLKALLTGPRTARRTPPAY